MKTLRKRDPLKSKDACIFFIQEANVRNNAKKERHVDILENTYVSVKEEKKERCAPRMVCGFHVSLKGGPFDVQYKI